MKRKIILTLAATTILGSTLINNVAASETNFVTIGTGGQTGVYYQVGGAICRLVNRESKDNGIKCTHTTGGSVVNINAIRSGDLDMGMAQSDWQYHAYNGTAPDQFPEGAYKDLRAVFSVYPEPFTVVVRRDSGIQNFDGLKGKRVNVGNPGSGTRATMEVVMRAKGLKMSDFALTSELKSSEMPQALCDNKIDAFVFPVGHPSGLIKEVTTSCDAILVSVTGPEIEKLISDNDFYDQAMIPGGMYKGTNEDVQVFGVGATFVTSAKVDDEIVYQLVKSVFDNLNRFRKLHPAFSNLNSKAMIKNNLSAPLHPGAIRYYKEAGLM